jgi:transcriptional regulator with XRE-family HTH domain
MQILFEVGGMVMSNIVANSYGDFIRQLRISKGITQEQLCTGLCDISTISRIERGVIAPKSYIRNAILERLGYYSENEQNGFTEGENPDLIHLKKALSLAIIQKDIKAMKNLIRELENKKEFEKGIGLQFILNSKASLDILDESENNFNFGKTMQMLLDSISITIPNFVEEKIYDYMMTREEMRSINLLCGIYHHIKDYDSALRVLSALKSNIDAHSVSKHTIVLYYTTILTNIVELHYTLKQYDECIKKCEECKSFCIQYHEYGRIPDITFIWGKCLLNVGKRSEAKDLFLESYYVSRSFGKFEISNEVLSYFAKTFNQKIEYQIEHQSKGNGLLSDSGSDFRIKKLLSVFSDEPMYAKELMERLGLSSKSNFLYKYLKPSIEKGYIEMVDSDNPRSRWQRYRVVLK